MAHMMLLKYLTREVQRASSRLITAALLLASWVQANAQNLLINGSFESPIVVSSTSLGFGSTNLSGWSIEVTGSVYLVRAPLSQLATAADGHQFVDLNGKGVTLSQTFETKVGEVYDVAFTVGQYQAPQITFKLQAAVLDSSGVVLTNTEVVAPQSLGWGAPARLRFTATTPTSTLRFTDTTGTSNIDLMLDAVSVRRVAPWLTIEISPLRVCWEARTNYLYQIQYSSQLTTNIWADLGAPISGTDSTNCTVLPVSAPYSLFRILVLQ